MWIKRKLEENEKKPEIPVLTAGKKKFLDFCCSCVKVILALILAILTITSMLVTCSVDWDEVVSYAPDRIYKHILFAIVLSAVLVLCRHIRNLLRGNWLEKVFRDLTVNLDRITCREDTCTITRITCREDTCTITRIRPAWFW